jgi:hypothetical protein
MPSKSKFIIKIQKDIDELILIAKIKLVLPKWLRDHPDEPNKVVNGINSETHIPVETIIAIFDKYTLSRILKIRTDINDLETKKIELQTNLNNLETYVWQSKYNELLT